MRRRVACLVLVLLVLGACAAPGGSPSGSAPVADGRIEHPSGSDPVLVLEQSGGFVPAVFVATRVPVLVILGDGRVIRHGAQTLEFPGPALHALVERTLTEAGIQAVLEALEETELFTSDLELRGAHGFVADAADTVFTVNAGGRQVTVSVYALGTLPPGVEPPPGMTAAEVRAHDVLGRLNHALMTLDGWLPAGAWRTQGWQPYEPERLRLYVRDVSGEPVEGGDLAPQLRAWPADDDPAAFGAEQEGFGDGTRCGVVEGDVAAAWVAELSAANQLTLWADDDERRFVVHARPVLPHEDTACPALFGA